MKEEQEYQFLRTEILYPKRYFVSTCYRRSSAVLAPDHFYYETFAWDCDEKCERQNIVMDNSGAVSSDKAVSQHFEVIKNLTTPSKEDK